MIVVVLVVVVVVVVVRVTCFYLLLLSSFLREFIDPFGTDVTINVCIFAGSH
jgi:hypothetical protein